MSRAGSWAVEQGRELGNEEKERGRGREGDMERGTEKSTMREGERRRRSSSTGQAR